jgi:hypothetical protein
MVCLLDAITIAFGRTCTTPAPKADKSSQKRNERRAGILELQTLNHQIIPNSGMSAGALSFQFFSGGKGRPSQFVFHKHARAYARVGADGAGARREVST